MRLYLTTKHSYFLLISSLCLGLCYSPTILAASQDFCKEYASVLTWDFYESCLVKKDPDWHKDHDKHFKECLEMTEDTARKKRREHILQVRTCGNIYKSISLKRNTVNIYALDDNEQMKMKPAPDVIKHALLNGEIDSPYSGLFPFIKQSISTNNLQRCDLLGLPVDMDMRPETHEWVITTTKACFPKREHLHTWIIQNASASYRVLFEGNASSLVMQISMQNGYRTLNMDADFLPEEKNKQRCGGVEASWHYKEGRYIPYKATAKEGGECLPDYYPLSEQVDIAQYPDLLDKEMKERMALYKPNIEAITDYIPRWIKRREHLTRIPDNNSRSIQQFNKAEEQAIKQLLDL